MVSLTQPCSLVHALLPICHRPACLCLQVPLVAVCRCAHGHHTCVQTRAAHESVQQSLGSVTQNVNDAVLMNRTDCLFLHIGLRIVKYELNKIYSF